MAYRKHSFDSVVEVIKPYVEEHNAYPPQKWFIENGYGGFPMLINRNKWRMKLIDHFQLTEYRIISDYTYEEVRDKMKEYTDIHHKYPPISWLRSHSIYSTIINNKKYRERLCNDLGVENKYSSHREVEPLTQKSIVKMYRDVSTDGMMPTQGQMKESYDFKDLRRINLWQRARNLSLYQLAELCDLTPTNRQFLSHLESINKKPTTLITFKEPDTSHCLFPVDSKEICKLLAKRINNGSIKLQ